MQQVLGAAIDAFLLKVAIEQELGYPTELIPDNVGGDVPPGSTAQTEMFKRMAAGEVHLYPEVTLADYRPCGAIGPQVVRVVTRRAIQVWRSQEQDLYTKYVKTEETVRIVRFEHVPVHLI